MQKVAEPIVMPSVVLTWLGRVLDRRPDCSMRRGNFEVDDVGICLHAAEHRSQWP